MVRSLEDLPVEIIELAVSLLSLSDVCSVRLVSRQLAVKASEGCFLTSCASKHVDISNTCLQTFVHMTQPGGIGCVLRDLTVVGVAIITHDLQFLLRKKKCPVIKYPGEHLDCTREELDARRELRALKQREVEHGIFAASGLDTALLEEGFRNLAANSKTRGLRSLSLEVVAYRDACGTRVQPIDANSWELIWTAAVETLRVTFTALADSGLAVEKLILFNTQQQCSVEVKVLSDLLDARQMTCLESVKSLAVSFSDPIIHDREQPKSIDEAEDDEVEDDAAETRRVPTEVLRAQVADQRGFTGLASLLKLMPMLEELELHSYRLPLPGLGFDSFNFLREQRPKTLGRIVDSVPLKHLRCCKLRGIDATEDALLSLVKQAPLLNLSLEWVHLARGTFRSIFDHCTSEAAKLERCYCDDLWEARLLQFRGAGASKGPKIPLAGGRGGGNTLLRDSANIKQPIVYHQMSGRALGSPLARRWKLDNKREYGSP